MAATVTPIRRSARNGSKPAEPLTRTVVMVDLDSIDIGSNVRVSVEAIDELAESIKSHGVLQPIKLRAAGDRWVVVWGQRRVLAARKAGFELIPALTTADEPTPEKVAAEQLVENLHRADLNPMDRARAMRMVVDSGMSQADLARELGLAPSTIANDIGLLAAPPKIQQALDKGEITPGHARAIKGLPAAEQVKLANLAIQHGKSAHELERDAKWARQEVARQERDRARLEKVAASAVAQLEKSVAKDVLIVVSGAVVANAIKKAGWTNLHAGERWNVDVVKKAGECGCSTWVVDYDTYGGKAEAKLKPACADADHRETRLRESRAARDVETAQRDAEHQAYGQRRATEHDAMVVGLTASLAPALSTAVAKGILAAIVGEGWDGRDLRERHGGDPNGWQAGDTWKVIAGLTPEDAIDELARAIAGELVPEKPWSGADTAGPRMLVLAAVAPNARPVAPVEKKGRRPRVAAEVATPPA